jgi:hypothetical protein
MQYRYIYIHIHYIRICSNDVGVLEYPRICPSDYMNDGRFVYTNKFSNGSTPISVTKKKISPADHLFRRSIAQPCGFNRPLFRRHRKLLLFRSDRCALITGFAESHVLKEENILNTSLYSQNFWHPRTLEPSYPRNLQPSYPSTVPYKTEDPLKPQKGDKEPSEVKERNLKTNARRAL